MEDKKLKPVMVVVPQKRTDSPCTLPFIVNGITFDLSSSHILRLPPTKSVSTPPDDPTQTISHTTSPISSTIISEGTTQTVSMAASSRDVRIVSHREVERRRKLKISTCIQQLADSLPYKILGKVSHGDVLESVVEHIKKLKQENESLITQSSADGEAKLKNIHAKMLLENLLLRELLHLLKHSANEDPHERRTDTLTTTKTHTSSTSLSTHQSWPVTSLLAATQTFTTMVSTISHTSTHHTSTPTPAIIVQPWVEPRAQPSHVFPLLNEVETCRSHSHRTTVDGLSTPSRDLLSIQGADCSRACSNRYRPYQRRVHSHNPPPIPHDSHVIRGDQRGCGHPQYPLTFPADYSDQSRYLPDCQQNVSRDSQAMPYDSYHSHSTVWRPYSDPHRLSGFGLSDILSHSHSEPLHLESTPPSHVNSSFLVDSLLEDI